jgi:LytS/YehU family sensor histidine kinase
VENAIKYSIRNRSEGGALNIAVERSDNSLNIAIEDNGPGPMTVNRKTESTGKGLIILEELIELFYKLEKTKITYSLKNKSNAENAASGTIATITLHSRNPKLS